MNKKRFVPIYSKTKSVLLSAYSASKKEEKLFVPVGMYNKYAEQKVQKTLFDLI